MKKNKKNPFNYVKGSWRLVDAEILAKKHKDTFYKPSQQETDLLEVGDLVKLIIEGDCIDQNPISERMWVKITEIKGGEFKGELDNFPFYIDDLMPGDFISFGHKHIINIYIVEDKKK